MSSPLAVAPVPIPIPPAPDAVAVEPSFRESVPAPGTLKLCPPVAGEITVPVLTQCPTLLLAAPEAIFPLQITLPLEL